MMSSITNTGKSLVKSSLKNFDRRCFLLLPHHHQSSFQTTNRAQDKHYQRPQQRCKHSHIFSSSTTSFTNASNYSFQKRNLSSSSSNSLPKEKNTNTLLTALQKFLPTIPINTNPYDLYSHGRGESYHPTAPPSAILTPSSSEEICTILQLCNEYKVPIIPYGAGTSVEGHLNALYGGISLDMVNFNEIDLVDEGDGMQDFFVRVGAGVTRKTLNEALRHTGMQFMVDPGADATIGGMVACGASGTTAVKYGTMRENIHSLTAILPNGTTVANLGSNTIKSSAGYDLTSLMTGSEGTLGVITSVTVKLHPIPEHVTAAICSFDNVHDAADAVTMMKMCNVPVARCELLDGTSVDAFNRYVQKKGSGGGGGGKTMPVKPTLFLEFTGHSAASVQEQVDATKSICIDCGGGEGGSDLYFDVATDEAERRALWSARHQLYYASISLRPGANSAFLTDVCVPLSKFADIISETVEDVKRLDVLGPCFGHAGDGNFHCIMPLLEDEGDTKDYLDRVHEVNDLLIHRTLTVGGTCTGEHGVGYGKIKYLKEQYGQGTLDMMKMIKMALDPNNIMNPGKVVPRW